MWIESVRLALGAILRNALRSLLTVLGVTIGVAAVIAMVTLGQGATAEVGESVASLGSNLLMVRPGQFSQTPGGGGVGVASLDVADAEAIARLVDDVRVAAPTDSRSLTVIANNTDFFTTVIGTDNRYLDAREWGLAGGRVFDEGELRAGSSVCIVGQGVVDALFNGLNPLGEAIRLRRMVCTVVGVLEEKGGSAFGSNEDDVIIVPLRTFQRRISGNAGVTLIYVAAADESALTRVKDDITALMRDRRNLSASEDNDFMVMDMRQVASMLGTIMGVLTGLLSAVAGISLVVGGIGIMNIMLASVTERTREIGIRLAIGARESQVLLQFLVEATLLSAIGGLIGIGLGLGLSALGAAYLGVPFLPDPLVVLLAFGFSGLVGIGFGYFPARGAARLDPIEALRRE
ncbi:ABC transporter permease [Devosia salina]|uniref:ABC transporter permease n=1 Tax=Devosia salina TaxID=2860336 RepID=A0ABX8WC80_9HYPH|nr:ABC transporter permease [Devosia salina]QYO76038.1 ABC transporter permease [Devosia salina]